MFLRSIFSSSREVFLALNVLHAPAPACPLSARATRKWRRGDDEDDDVAAAAQDSGQSQSRAEERPEKTSLSEFFDPNMSFSRPRRTFLRTWEVFWSFGSLIWSH